MKFNIIIAVDINNGISKDGEIPWKITEDMKYFKRITTDSRLPKAQNAVIMGRKTCESLPNKYLNNRLNVVLTRSVDYKNDKVIKTNNFIEALRICNDNFVDSIWVIGGKEIYDLAFKSPDLDKIYLTVINKNFNCDNIVELPKFKIISTTSQKLIDSNNNEELKILNVICEPQLNCEHLYLNLLKKIIKNGNKRETRNGTTLSVFSDEIKFNISENFPLLTTKKMFWRGIVEELLFFIRGDTDTKKLEEKNINIWKGNTSKDFLSKMELDYEEGVMGPMYGYQWRYFNKPLDQDSGGIDQLKDLIDLIKKDPNSRRLLMTDYNPSQVSQGVLYPCHSLILQFYVEDNKLSVKMYQRSADVFLGLPFNIASTSLLLTIISKLCNLMPNNVTLSLGDCHIYSEHLDAVRNQLGRNCLDLPKLEIPEFKTLEEVENSKFEDYKIVDYINQGSIKAEMVA